MPTKYWLADNPYCVLNDTQAQNIAKLADALGLDELALLTTVESAILDGATLTTTEINRLDDSAEVETLLAAGAISILKKNTKVELVGAGAITLAVPDATMLGKVKLIEMTVDNGDVTLALTNVQGGSAATTATFDAVGETLILVGGVSKWNVIAEVGVTLS